MAAMQSFYTRRQALQVLGAAASARLRAGDSETDS